MDEINDLQSFHTNLYSERRLTTLHRDRNVEEMKICFSYWLNKRMREQGLTQKQFARLAGVSEQTMSSYIFGGSLPKYEHLFIFADILDCTPNDLMCYDEQVLKSAKNVEEARMYRKRRFCKRK